MFFLRRARRRGESTWRFRGKRRLVACGEGKQWFKEYPTEALPLSACWDVL